ncbi:MAG: M23 family metallopeptidase [Actinomycetaceae bacterium]|nr:M23 family metallopeptidase [Actinomycetaceae bacterium]
MKVDVFVKRIFSQLGILAALATFTVAVPLTGFVGTDTTLTVPGRDVVVAGNQAHSWGDTSSRTVESTAAANETGDDIELVPAVLAATSDAQAKARVTAAEKAPLPSCDAKYAARGEANMRGNNREEAIYYPLTKGSFTYASPFGYRVHPIFHVGRLHAGVDMAAPAMTPVHAAAKGTVVFVGPWGGGGNIVRIEHNIEGEHFFTQYLHLTTGSAVVAVGDQVEAGQHIAGVGSTGNSTGYHLHFEVRPTMDTPVDPVHWLESHNAVFLGQETC